MSFRQMYNAIGKPRYEGLFITAVKSTGVFCRPSCRARKPLSKNVIFFNSAEEAMAQGFRPCKICRPLDLAGEPPLEIQSLLRLLYSQPQQRIKDSHLKEMGLEPSRIRRWFKNQHNMTFQSFQRLIRIDLSRQNLQKGQSVTDTAFDSGFDSLSGFTDRYKSIFGVAPSQKGEKNVIHLKQFMTPLGPMVAGASQNGLCLLEFVDRKRFNSQLKSLEKGLKAVLIPGHNRHLAQAEEELKEYFKGIRKVFSVPLDMPGTVFQQSVWQSLLLIPYGKTWSYLDQAKAIKKPSAVRAVAQANGRNRIAIIVPCHRVIGSNGKLTGYAAGIPKKKWLLDFEKKKE